MNYICNTSNTTHVLHEIGPPHYFASVGKLCNSIPVAIRCVTLKTCFKTYLFNLAYPSLSNYSLSLSDSKYHLCYQVLLVEYVFLSYMLSSFVIVLVYTAEKMLYTFDLHYTLTYVSDM